jgi:hypothetical protein
VTLESIVALHWRHDYTGCHQQQQQHINKLSCGLLFNRLLQTFDEQQ